MSYPRRNRAGNPRERAALGWLRGGALGDRRISQQALRSRFEQIDIEPTRVYRAEDAREFLAAAGIDVDAIVPRMDGKFFSAFVRAVKPAKRRSESVLRTNLLQLGENKDARTLQRFYSCARAILRGRSWLKQFSTPKAGLTSRLTAPEVIPPERFDRRR